MTDQNNVAASTMELKLTDNMRVALDHAFDDARECLQRDGGMTPFTIICTSDGYVVSDHPGDAVDEIYMSVKALLAQELPEAYVFGYDGYVDLDDGRRDAILVEIAKRGDAVAQLLAQPYAVHEDGTYEFTPTYMSAGTAKQLYPSGTKPIVSGLVQLAAERKAEEDAVRGASPAAAEVDQASEDDETAKE